MSMRKLAVVAAAALAGTLASAPAQAVTNAPFRWGFVWANLPTAGSYTPSMSFQANSTDGTNTIVRSGPGAYVVTFPGLGWPLTPPSRGAGGNVQVTAYGAGPARCKVERWDSDGSTLTVKVLCFTAAGAPVDSRYTVLYQADELPGGNDAGYALVTAAGAAPTQFQVNSSGPAVLNTVTHTGGSGLYRIVLPGLAVSGGNLQVTGYGPGSVHCKVRSLNHDDVPGETVVVVGCHNSTGTLVDSAFSIAYTSADSTRRARASSSPVSMTSTCRECHTSTTPTSSSRPTVRGRRRARCSPGVPRLLPAPPSPCCASPGPGPRPTTRSRCSTRRTCRSDVAGRQAGAGPLRMRARTLAGVASSTATSGIHQVAPART
jgi:hypothetical protein